MTRLEARDLADKIILKLKPYVERGHVAGSYRRGKVELKDLDIVVIPKRQDIKDMFGTVIGTKPVQGFIDVINSWKKLKGDPEGRYCQREIDGHKVEISIATKENWGCLLLIRTGNDEFSHKIMTRVRRLGLEQRDGYLYRDDKMIPVYEEKQYFDILNLPFIEPHLRNESAFTKAHKR